LIKETLSFSKIHVRLITAFSTAFLEANLLRQAGSLPVSKFPATAVKILAHSLKDVNQIVSAFPLCSVPADANSDGSASF
jgi:hypothetical protein